MEDPTLETRFANDEYDWARRKNITDVNQRNYGAGGTIGTEYDTPTNGLFQVYWSNGNLRYEWYYKDGKVADGKSYGWNEDGSPKQTITRKNNIVNKLTWYWYGTTQKMDERTYNKSGDIDGLYTKWYENGKKKCEGNYKSGELISSKCWNKDGNKCECGERWIEGCKKD